MLTTLPLSVQTSTVILWQILTFRFQRNQVLVLVNGINADLYNVFFNIINNLYRFM